MMNISRSLRYLLLCLITLFTLASCGGGTGDTTGPIKSWSVNLVSKTGSCFKPNDLVELEIIAKDSNGKQIPNPGYEVSAAPADGIVIGTGGEIRTRGEGPLTLTVSYTGDNPDNADISPVTFNMLRDGTAPVISITSPARGVMVNAANISDSLSVQGSVDDSLGNIAAININGKELTVDGSSSNEIINSQISPVWGTNVIHITATDTCGNVAEHSQAFLWSEDYLPPILAKNTAARSPAANSMRLTQEVIDDGNRQDFDDITTIAAQYLQQNQASLLTTVMQNVSYSHTTVTKDPFFGTVILRCTYSAGFAPGAQVTMNGPFMQTKLLNGQTHHVVTINSLSVPIRYRQYCINPQTGVSTNLQSTFIHKSDKVTIDMDLGYDVDSNRQLQTRVVSINTNGNFTVDSSSNPKLATAINAILTWFTDINSYIEQQISNQLRQSVPKIMNDMLETFVKPQAINLPAPFNKSINVAADWSSISVTPEAINPVMGQYIYPNNVMTPYADRGAITRHIAATSLATNPENISAAISDDGINQVLWALWYGGGLEQSDLTSYANLASEGKVDLSGLSLKISGLLPPVLMPSSEQRQMVFGVGDVHVMGSVDLAQNSALSGSGILAFDVYTSAIIHEAVYFNMDDNNMNLIGHSMANQTYIDIHSLTLDGIPVKDPNLIAAIRAYLKQVMQPTLVHIMHDTIAAIPLPRFRTDLPQGSFGSNSALIFDIQHVQRDSDRFVVSIDVDPDISADIPIMQNWQALQQAASEAAGQEAYLWLTNAGVRQGWCSVNGPTAYGNNVLEGHEPMGHLIKDRLLAAGADIRIARDWNRAFKAAWYRWANNVSIPALPWYPAFALFPTDFAPPTPNIPSPLGSLTSTGPGGNAMLPANLSTSLQANLSYTTSQVGAVDAFDAFADNIGGRFSLQLNLGNTVVNVLGSGPVAHPGPIPCLGCSSRTNPNGLIGGTPPPPTSPPPVPSPVVGGTCWGGSISASAFQ